jgi:4-diphosphocytidyl-2-C-methyl-D-erythritol kinase
LKVALPARAKLNLDLQVIKRRADGFHEIRTHMQAVALHDLVEASPSQRTTLAVDGIPVTAEADNIILKALTALEGAAGRALPTDFHLHKRIPPGAGLGGASSDAATALRAAAIVHGVDIDIESIARAVGADVPFFMKGGSALAEGTGERLQPLPTEPAWYAIAWPGIELSTANVYEAWDQTRGGPPNELLQAAERADPRVQDFARRLGHGWQMTGSGSAFFLRCAGREEGMKAIESLDCWTTVTHAVGAWA